tara:strand:+ start:1980 stop:2132 length:153 start_codon:yes stop_codon:yes gene_type:complete
MFNNRTASVTFYRNDMGLITVDVPATNYDSAVRTVREQYGDVDVKRVNLN